MNTELNEAAEKWHYDYKFLKDLTYKINGCEYGEGLSMKQVEAVLDSINAAQWQAEQKQMPTDEEIEKLIDKHFSASYANESGEPLFSDSDLQKGLSALQYSVGDGALWETQLCLHTLINRVRQCVNKNELVLNEPFQKAFEDGLYILKKHSKPSDALRITQSETPPINK